MITLLLTLWLSTPAHAYLVISDVDDTVKITNSGHTLQSAWSGLFKEDVFPGMPEIYRAWANDGATLHFVTASPTLIRPKMRELLQHHRIPFASLTLRGNLLESKLKYKVCEISRIMERSPHDEVVLVGDDVGQDPEVFAALVAKYPGRVRASYIRPVKNRAALAGQIPYVTAFDIASDERFQGRLGADAIAHTTVAVLTGNAWKLIPKFAWCPRELDGSEFPTERSPYAIAERIEEHVERICRERRSGIENLP